MPDVSSSASHTDDLPDRLRAVLGDGCSPGGELSRWGGARRFRVHSASHSHDLLAVVLERAGEASTTEDIAQYKSALRDSAALSHPGILRIISAGTVDGRLYYLSALPRGEPLREVLGRDFRLAVGHAAQIVADLCTAVQHAHDQGVLHLDIRPAHVWLENDRAVIGGFGVARAAGIVGHEVPGDAGYAAPEQLRDSGSAGTRADVYSLGILAYELLAGERPYLTDAHALATGPLVAEPPKLAAVRRDIPQGLSEVVYRAMSRDPARRYRSAEAFRRAIVKAAAPPSVRLRNALLVGSLVLATVAVVFFALRLSRKHGIDDSTLAIAPFSVTDSRLAPWSEGIVDLVSAQLDGMSELHAIPAHVSVRHAATAPVSDHGSAAEFGKALGARLALYGRLAPAGRDSVRLTASVIDVLNGSSITNIELTQRTERLDALVDSLAGHIVFDITGVPPARLATAPLGTRSLAALAAFVRGEQAYRRAQWDSAHAGFRNAVRIDPSFTVALSRIGRLGMLAVLPPGETRDAFDAMQRATQLNRGLARRESLFVLRDSLALAVERPEGQRRSLLERWKSVLDSLTAGYPRDAEAWTIAALDRGGWLRHLGMTSEAVLPDAERAVSLDSSIALPYVLAYRLAWDVAGYSSTERIFAALSSRVPDDRSTRALRLIRDVRASPAAVDAPAPELLTLAAAYSAGLPDSLDTALRLARSRIQAGALGNTVVVEGMPRSERDVLAGVFLAHGSMREAQLAGAQGLVAAERALVSASDSTGRYPSAGDASCVLACYAPRLLAARHFNNQGRELEAEEVILGGDGLFSYPSWTPFPLSRVLWWFESARAAHRRGAIDRAVRDYRRVLQAFSAADPELEPIVREARNAVSTLAR